MRVDVRRSTFNMQHMCFDVRHSMYDDQYWARADIGYGKPEMSGRPAAGNGPAGPEVRKT